MMDDKMTFDEILIWYSKNVQEPISIKLLEYMAERGILDVFDGKCSLFELNDYILDEKKNSNKFSIKENKITIVEFFNDVEKIKDIPPEEETTIQWREPEVKIMPTPEPVIPFKFKITQGKGKKMKLIRL